MKILNYIFSIKNNLDKKIFRILGINFSCSRFKQQKIKPFSNNKPTIAFQVNEMDKGGLEEVVLQLATNNKIHEKYNTVIIAEKTNKGYLANIAKKNGVPVYSFFSNPQNIKKIIEILNIKIVHFHYNISGIEEYKNYGLKTIYTIHNNYIWMDKKDIASRNNIYLYIDKFIAVSSQVKEYFCEKFDYPLDKVDVISNGIEYFDTTDIQPFSKKEIGLDDNDFLLLNVASFNLNKYHFSQLKVLSLVIQKYKNIKLFFIGNVHDKKYFKKLKEMIVDLKLENNVKILDFVPKSEVFRYVKTADVVIMTSLTEGFSIAMSETMLLGTPMILTDVGGARDVINNNDIGILVPHAFKNLQDIDIIDVENKYKNNEFYFGNVEIITNAIENMYLNKNEWRNKAKLGIEKVKNYFNVDRVCRDYFFQYDELNCITNKNKGLTPKVSVILSVYNVESYLPECLDSIINQTLKDIEIICINDGSTDSSLVILNEYTKKNSRIRIINQENKGAGAARNKGIEISKGEFVCFMDPDDLYPTNDILEMMYNKAKENGVNICGGEFSDFENGTHDYKQVYGDKYAGYLFEMDDIVNYKDYQFDYGYHRFIYNREFLVKNNIYFPEYRRYQDPPFFVNAMIQADKFYGMHKITYAYRCGHKNVLWTEKSILDMMQGILNDFRYAKQNKFDVLKQYTYLHYLDHLYAIQNCLTLKIIFKLLLLSSFEPKILGFLCKKCISTIFSIKNENSHIVVTILGIKIKFKNSKLKQKTN